MKRKILTVLAILLGLAGLGVLLYPSVSNWMEQAKQRRQIAAYQEAQAQMEQKRRAALLAEADRYNQKLAELGISFDMLGEAEKKALLIDGKSYDELLLAEDSGVMGYLEIPEIRVKLPIYHGTGDFAICNGAGHVEGSSFPIGGKGTHAVLSSHRGLPGAKLFSDLDKLKVGDYFTITVLRQTIFYQIDRIDIVEPEETGLLALDKEKDYCTLLTCTPYGINTKRLLVRGVRCEVTERAEPIRTGEKTYRRWYAAIGLNVFVAGMILCWKRKKKRRG